MTNIRESSCQGIVRRWRLAGFKVVNGRERLRLSRGKILTSDMENLVISRKTLIK